MSLEGLCLLLFSSAGGGKGIPLHAHYLPARKPGVSVLEYFFYTLCFELLYVKGILT